MEDESESIILDADNSVSKHTTVTNEEIEPVEIEIEDEEPQIDPRAFLTKDQVKEFKKIFSAYDENNEDKIPVKTIGIVLRNLGFNPSKATVKRIIKEIDPDKNGYMNFETFLLPIAQRIHEVPETYEDIIKAFKILDEDDEGFISVKTLTEFLTNLAEDLEDFEMESFIKTADPKGTGRVYYEGFVEKIFGVVKNVKKKSHGKKSKKKKK